MDAAAWWLRHDGLRQVSVQNNRVRQSSHAVRVPYLATRRHACRHTSTRRHLATCRHPPVIAGTRQPLAPTPAVRQRVRIGGACRPPPSCIVPLLCCAPFARATVVLRFVCSACHVVTVVWLVGRQVWAVPTIEPGRVSGPAAPPHRRTSRVKGQGFTQPHECRPNAPFSIMTPLPSHTHTHTTTTYMSRHSRAVGEPTHLTSATPQRAGLNRTVFYLVPAERDRCLCRVVIITVRRNGLQALRILEPMLKMRLPACSFISCVIDTTNQVRGPCTSLAQPWSSLAPAVHSGNRRGRVCWAGAGAAGTGAGGERAREIRARAGGGAGVHRGFLAIPYLARYHAHPPRTLRRSTTGVA